MTKKTTGMLGKPWVQELLTRESFTSKDAAELSGWYSGDALTRLRCDKQLRLITLGPLPGGHPRAKLFRLERVKGANDINS
jgi:hypothetical protein